LTRKLVIDASVALKWILNPIDEPYADRAADLLFAARRSDVELFAPSHWLSEVIAVVAREAPERVSDAIDILFALEVDSRLGPSTYLRGALLSVQLSHHLFDTLYHAVAIETEAILVTADERYFAKAEPLGAITMLGAWTG
jgi:predicted nucleic acid-binding protein